MATAVWFLLAAFCGLFELRLFMLFHDCAHNSFFPSTFANKMYCWITSAQLITPYSGWKGGHDYHHRVSNNDDKKQYSQTAPWSLEQFNKASRWQRIGYSLIYGKFTLVSTTPILYFAIVQRFLSTAVENIWFIVYWISVYKSGLLPFQAAGVFLAAIIGLYLFHIQHTFEGSYHAPAKYYDRFINGVEGSSILVCPWWLEYWTARIEYHHIHHLNAHVPCYRLKECHRAAGEMFDSVPRLSLYDAISTITFSLRKEDRTFANVYEQFRSMPSWVPDLVSCFVVTLLTGLVALVTARPYYMYWPLAYTAVQVLFLIRNSFIDNKPPNLDEATGKLLPSVDDIAVAKQPKADTSRLTSRARRGGE
jgi:omega-6 fatty acid desaturase (delta-12 desaturase)